VPKRIGAWALAVLVALDILLAALLGGHTGETVSHMAQRHRDTWGGAVCAVLDALDPEHCATVRY
jgi:LDH2 family malate/lactate/ureidoglycolate dehydrogenase